MIPPHVEPIKTDVTDGQTYINAFFMELLCLIKNNVYLCRLNMIFIN